MNNPTTQHDYDEMARKISDQSEELARITQENTELREKADHIRFSEFEAFINPKEVAARINSLEEMLSRWVRPCFCESDSMCLLCQTRNLLKLGPPLWKKVGANLWLSPENETMHSREAADSMAKFINFQFDPKPTTETLPEQDKVAWDDIKIEPQRYSHSILKKGIMEPDVAYMRFDNGGAFVSLPAYELVAAESANLRIEVEELKRTEREINDCTLRWIARYNEMLPDRDRLNDENEKLLEALKQYGFHQYGCVHYDGSGKCDCGLSSALGAAAPEGAKE